MKNFKNVVMVAVFFAMLILGSVKTSYAMTVEEGRHLFYREYREDFRTIKEDYGPYELHNTDYGFVLIFQDEEEAWYSMVEYDFEECTCTTWDWDYNRETEEFDWKEMLIERLAGLD